MLTFLGILLFILVQLIYDSYCVYDCTNCSIFYFTGLYVSFLIICIDKFLYEYDRVIKNYMISAIILFSILIIRELTLINSEYTYYIQSVNSRIAKISGMIYFAITSFLITYKFIQNVRKTKR